jgi:hypothetical protein
MKLSELTKKHSIICRSEQEWERIAKLLHEDRRRWQSGDAYWPLLYKWEGSPAAYVLDGTYFDDEAHIDGLTIESTEIENPDQEAEVHQTFQVGDKCWSPTYGHGEVVELDNLVKVNFRNVFGVTWHWHYQPDGREHPESPQPTLFHQEVKEWPCPERLVDLPKLNVDDKVYVESNGVWVAAHFSQWLVEKDKIAMGVFSEGKTSHTTNGDIWFYTAWKIAD